MVFLSTQEFTQELRQCDVIMGAMVHWPLDRPRLLWNSSNDVARPPPLTRCTICGAQSLERGCRIFEALRFCDICFSTSDISREIDERSIFCFTLIKYAFGCFQVGLKPGAIFSS